MTSILAIDTATSGCAAAIWREGICLARDGTRMPRGQSEALAPMIQSVQQASSIAFSDLDAVAVTRGPGAFTGLRIGLSAARALALTLGVPCIGIGTFEALLADARRVTTAMPPDALVVAIESKRDDLYLNAVGGDGQELLAPSAAFPSALEAALSGAATVAVAGDAAGRVAEHFAGRAGLEVLDEIDLPDVMTVAGLAAGYLQAGAAPPASPLYLRPPDVTIAPAS